ncbi:MAG: protein of unknown function with transrane region [Candidatus Taylorbacteria bacterium]|nr:protein of unknown function with transrane region [Candidatus Taylorbacteria bacterium]
METKFQTSFIPKTSLDPIATNTVHKPLGFFSFISSIIFFITVLVAGGAFGWDKYLETSKAKIQSDLERNVKSFEPQTLDEYVRLNNRIDSAKTLLASHVAVSYIFDFLQESTIQSVKFNDFKYEVGPDGTASLTMNGQAKSYNAVAYQAEVFGKERALKTPLFSNLDLDTFGNVIFNFTTKIDPGFINYTRKASTDTSASPDNIINTPSNTPAANTPNTSMIDNLLNPNPNPTTK